MSTRKPKPALPSMIELPAEQLQLVTVTVEQKAPAPSRPRTKEFSEGRSLPRPGKITLH
jgi:hypothetical protein